MRSFYTRLPAQSPPLARVKCLEGFSQRAAAIARCVWPVERFITVMHEQPKIGDRVRRVIDRLRHQPPLCGRPVDASTLRVFLRRRCICAWRENGTLGQFVVSENAV
jgi:hypothetical protein